jgi:small subunit ribosomal protein S1
VRVADGIEGLVHISELSGKHVELAEQVVSVGEEVFVKIIDIDLERRRISLSLKQANEAVDPYGTEFDPALYGMVTEYDEHGRVQVPRGLRPRDQRVARGLRQPAREVGAGVRSCPGRWEAHKKQVAAANAAAVADDSFHLGAASFSTDSRGAGTLADDASLAALREKLSSNN